MSIGVEKPVGMNPTRSQNNYLPLGVRSIFVSGEIKKGCAGNGFPDERIWNYVEGWFLITHVRTNSVDCFWGDPY